MRNTLAMLVLGSENVPSTGMTLPSGSPEPLRRVGAVSRTALSLLVHAPESKRIEGIAPLGGAAERSTSLRP